MKLIHLSLLFLPLQLQSGVVTLISSGTISVSTLPSVPVGSPFTVTMSYDSDSTPINPGDPTNASYYTPTFMHFESAGSSLLQIAHYSPGDMGVAHRPLPLNPTYDAWDWIILGNTTATGPLAADLTFVYAWGPGFSVVPTILDAVYPLPTSFPTGWTDARFRLVHYSAPEGNYDLYGTIVSVQDLSQVPESTTTAVIVGGLLILAGSRRRMTVLST